MEHPLPQYVYVASSWRCRMQQAVVHTLRAANIDCYDFKDEGASFQWQEANLPYHALSGLASANEFIAALQHPRAIAGFNSDFAAMERADTFVLVLPCNRSAHLELGWAIGKGKRTAILLDGPMVVPELMYKMADHISPNMFDLLGWLGVKD